MHVTYSYCDARRLVIPALAALCFSGSQLLGQITGGTFGDEPAPPAPEDQVADWVLEDAKGPPASRTAHWSRPEEARGNPGGCAYMGAGPVAGARHDGRKLSVWRQQFDCDLPDPDRFCEVEFDRKTPRTFHAGLNGDIRFVLLKTPAAIGVWKINETDSWEQEVINLPGCGPSQIIFGTFNPGGALIESALLIDNVLDRCTDAPREITLEPLELHYRDLLEDLLFPETSSCAGVCVNDPCTTVTICTENPLVVCTTITVSTCTEVSLLPWTSDTIVTCCEIEVSTCLLVSTCITRTICVETSASAVLQTPTDAPDAFRSEEGNSAGARPDIKAQTYPNPFQSSAVIDYELHETAQVELTVYNGLGVDIRTLLRQEQIRGRHSVTFDATGLPPGSYFYRLRVGNNVITNKLIVLK